MRTDAPTGDGAFKKQVGIKTELHTQRLDTYPFGNDSLIPIGVDAVKTF